MGIIAATASLEWNRLKHNRRDLFVMVAIPLLYLTLFGFLYLYNTVNHISTVVWDQDNSSLSRMVIDNFRSSDRFEIIGEVETNQELQDIIDSGKAKVGVVIPPGFMKDVKKQHSSQVLVCVDGTNLVISNTVFSSALEIVQTVSGGLGVRIMEGAGTLPGRALKTAVPVSFRMRIWYNPTNSYSVFLLLGLLGTTIQQVILLFTSVAVVRDKVTGIVPSGRFREMAGYVLGKFLPYMLINFISLNVVLSVLTAGFGVPFRGSLTSLLVLETVFITGIISLGIFISIVSRNELEATQVSMLIAVPSFLMSGYTWPLEAMPGPVSAISRCLPLTYFVSALRNLALKGSGLNFLLPDILFLTGLGMILFPAAVYALKINVNNVKIPSDTVTERFSEGT